MLLYVMWIINAYIKKTCFYQIIVNFISNWTYIYHIKINSLFSKTGFDIEDGIVILILSLLLLLLSLFDIILISVAEELISHTIELKFGFRYTKYEMNLHIYK